MWFALTRVWRPGRPARSRRPRCASRSPRSRRSRAATRGAGRPPGSSSTARTAAARAATSRGGKDTPGLAVDHRLAESADVRRHQWSAGRGRFQCDDAERLVVAGQHGGVGAVQQRDELLVVDAADEVDGLEHLVLSRLLDQPVLLGAVAGDGQRGARDGCGGCAAARRWRRARPSRTRAGRGRAARAGPRARSRVARTARGRRRCRCG